MTRPDITATLSHHADEAKTIMHGEELDMFEPEEIATTETLPEVLTAAQVTTAELARRPQGRDCVGKFRHCPGSPGHRRRRSWRSRRLRTRGHRRHPCQTHQSDGRNELTRERPGRGGGAIGWAASPIFSLLSGSDPYIFNWRRVRRNGERNGIQNHFDDRG